MDSQVDFINNKRLLCLITGASRGIGKEIALRLAYEKAADDSTFLLIARNGDDLEKTKNEIFSYCNDKSDQKKKKLTVEILAMDLVDLEHRAEELKDKLQDSFSKRNLGSKFDRAILIHNAGSLGPIDHPVQNFVSFSEIRRYMDLNFASMVVLNNLFLNFLDDVDPKIDCPKIVVNLTSITAVSGLAGFGLYSAGKAAREGFMRSLAADNPALRVLNYSPGPVATAMLDQLCHESWNQETRHNCEENGQHFHVVTCRDTVSKLLRILDANRYENGTRIDFFDEEPL